MKIAPGSVVTLAYDISTAEGEVVESSSLSGPITFIQGQGTMLPGLDTKILGMEQGEEATFELAPAEAFGMPDDGPLHTIPRNEFPSQSAIEQGKTYEARLPGGQAIQLKVVEISEGEITARMVHPLAGKTISVNVTIEGVRVATRAETQSGKVVTSPPPPPARPT